MIPRIPPETKGIFGFVDVMVFFGLAAGIYGVVTVGREWTGILQPTTEIHLSPTYLPLYMLFSLSRSVLAYAISFLFTMGYGYAAARIKGADRFMLPLLDILQSIPVLGFLPGFLLVLVHLFPHRNFGLEMASVLMIFTGQVWNMVFAFYHSLKSVPRDLTDVAELSKLSSWQRFSRLDLPFATHGLVWNSMLSMAGGWFFLTVSEAFVLGQHDFRLPGVGSYMSVAIEKGNVSAQICGILAMAGMILLLDQLVWRPLVSWSVKFSPEEVVAQRTGNSWLWTRIQRSHLFRNLAWMKGRFAWPRKARGDGSLDSAGSAWGWNRTMLRWMIRGLIAMVAVTCSYGVIKYVQLLRTLDAQEWQRIAMSGLLTFTRVAVAVLVASIWTIPAGVAIGRSPRWRVALQPVIQVMASFPAPMIFPLALGLLFSMGLGLGVGSMVLLVLAIQWYILFNVVAGVGQIAPELWEVARLTRLSRQQQWRKLILPGIFPFLLVGWMTAMGGAWNASIVAELVHYNGKTMMTTGLGALISEATSEGRFPLLAAAVGTMAVVVVAFNRLVWHPLSRQAQTRFQAEA